MPGQAIGSQNNYKCFQGVGPGEEWGWSSIFFDVQYKDFSGATHRYLFEQRLVQGPAGVGLRAEGSFARVTAADGKVLYKHEL